MKADSFFFHFLANKYSEGGAISLAKLLPSELSQEILSAPSIPGKEPEALLDLELWFKKIHYSWFLEPLEKLSQPFRRAVICAMPAEMRNMLLPEEKTEVVYPPRIASLVLDAFRQFFFEQEPRAQQVCPRVVLPKVDIGWMLTLSKQELVDAIDYLSMYDLADEVRHIVDRKLLQMIVGRLPQRVQCFLRSCLSHKTKLALAPMHVEQIYRDQKQFQNKLHRRGIQRLSIALSGQSEDFLWHLLHTFDTGRGKLLMKQIQHETQPATASAKMQLMVVLQYMKDLKEKRD